MLKLSFTFEMDEEQLRDLFEDNGFKFTKKKAKELQTELDHSLDEVQIDLEERFQEVIEEWLSNVFDK